MLDKAIELAIHAHRGQFDDEPYVFHPLRVMMRMRGESGRIAGVLHDVVEKGGVTLEQLYAQGFSGEIVEAVDALSRRRGEKYFDYIQRAAGNKLAAAVKLADLKDNIKKAEKNDDASAEKNIRKYRKAKKIIKRKIKRGIR